MVPAFGFSVGDFINVLSLINKIRKALKDTDGADDDIRAVSQDLEQLELVLNHLVEGHWGQECDVGCVNAVRGVAISCQVPLERYLKRLETFAADMKRSGDLHYVLSRNATKAQWALFIKDETVNFRSTLTSRIVLLSLLIAIPINSRLERIDNSMTKVDNLLQKTTADILSRMRDQRVSDEETVRTIFSLEDLLEQNQAMATADMGRLLEICLGIKTFVEKWCRDSKIQHSHRTVSLSIFSKVFGYMKEVKSSLSRLIYVFREFSLEALRSLKKLVVLSLEIRAVLEQVLIHVQSPQIPSAAGDSWISFQDALGRVKELPYVWFQHYEIFVAMLRCSFEDSPGQHYVLHGMFNIWNISPVGWRRMNQSNWKEIVIPKSKLRMAILADRDRSQQNQCHCCLTDSPAQHCVIVKMVRCLNCHLDSIPMTEASSESAVLDAPGTDSSGRGRNVQTEQASPDTDRLTVSEAALIRREAVEL